MLEEMGALVAEADCGEKALLRVQTDPDIDLMLADYTMPKMNGVDLAREVRIKLPGLPVVLMTGYSAAALGDSGPDISEILQKPFRAEALAEALLRALGDGPQGHVTGGHAPDGASGPAGDMPSRGPQSAEADLQVLE
jgi:CheY-like chemotaxis protein